MKTDEGEPPPSMKGKKTHPKQPSQQMLDFLQEKVEDKIFNAVYSESYSNFSSKIKSFHSATLKTSVLN